MIFRRISKTSISYVLYGAAVLCAISKRNHRYFSYSQTSYQYTILEYKCRAMERKKNDRRLEHEEREGGRKNVSFNIARYEVIEKVFNSTEMTITESVCCQINIFASSCSLLKKKRCKKRTQHTYCMPCHMAYIVVA